MRVLFLYDPKSTQASPVLRAMPELKERGIDLSPSHSTFDLVFAQQTRWGDVPEGFPIVILERIDGAQLTSTARIVLKHPNVKACVKNTIFADLSEYNRTRWRYHEDVIRRLKGDANSKEPPGLLLEKHELSKIKLGFSFGSYDKLDAFANQVIDWEAERPIDVFFAGTVDYNDDLITWHRQKCVEAVKALGCKTVCEPGRAMNQNVYRTAMLSSKIVVAPWGWGESTYREYEGALSGCVVIKPSSRHMLNPDSLQCHWCKPDFSDLGGMADDLICRFDSLVEFRRYHRERLLEDRRPDTVAARLAGIFESALTPEAACLSPSTSAE